MGTASPTFRIERISISCTLESEVTCHAHLQLLRDLALALGGVPRPHGVVRRLHQLFVLSEFLCHARLKAKSDVMHTYSCCVIWRLERFPFLNNLIFWDSREHVH